MELSNVGRKLRVYAILCRVIEIKNEAPTTIEEYKKKYLSVGVTSFEINDTFADLEDDYRCEFIDIEDDPRVGWVKPQKIGLVHTKKGNRVQYNQRKNLNSTTIKR